ncbi:hypothetical protein [Mycetocola sp. 2940]|uniref:hypothetical protein n=1 Tax=Mycetocola sp. 2940 TaxID=3156452 RepID=UPI003394FD5E
MSEVDPDDDTIWRWVIHHYRFDPTRNQRRNVRVAAYDDESEFRSELDRYTELIRSEIAVGTRSNRESVSGIALEPGHLAAQAGGHDVRRAIEHNVNPERLLRTAPIPHNMALLGFHDEDSPPAGPRP